MKITIITLFPQMIQCFLSESIIKRAQEKGTVEIEIVNLRDFAEDSYGSVDDRPYGGGAGMVLRVDVVKRALSSLRGPRRTSGDEAIPLHTKNESTEIAALHPPSGGSSLAMTENIVMTSARGKRYTQAKAQEYSKLEHLMILAGHYEGFDERIGELVDEEVSLGDFVLTGGEIPAAAIIDSVVRLLPGTLKKEEATQIESFFTIPLERLVEVVGEDDLVTTLKEKEVKEVQLLEYPQYTRPEDFEGMKVPEVLLGGNHKEIENWRIKKAYEVTKERRQDLLKV